MWWSGQFVFAYNSHWMNFWMSLSFSCSLRLPGDLWWSQQQGLSSGSLWCPNHPDTHSHLIFVPSVVIFIFFSSWSFTTESCIFLILLLSILTFLSMLISQKKGKSEVLTGDPAATWLYQQFCWLFSCNISMVCDMLWYNIIWYDMIQYNMI